MTSEEAQWLCRELGYVLSDAAKEFNGKHASLRDQFAGLALQGLLAAPHSDNWSWPPHSHQPPDEVAKQAYALADAMLRCRAEMAQ